MRQRESNDGVTVNAVAGTYVVTLGMNLTARRRKGCLGFAIQREDKTEDERYWMRGMKTFAETDPGLAPGGNASSREQPFQSFQWADYSAKPGHSYAYTVIPLYGTPSALREGPATTVAIETEAEIGKPHSVFFNRGAAASQQYAVEFEDKAPDELEGPKREAAYRWLSRGLFEAMIAFIERAEGDGWGLYGAIYELRWPDTLKALREAKGRGAEVKVLYDAAPKSGKPNPNGAGNLAAVKDAKITGLCKPRTTGYLMHNKFFVLTKDGKPVSVWTGSTNVTENGIFGHLNCGHIVEDPSVAKEYLDYWEEIYESPENAAEKTWMGKENPRPPDPGSAPAALTTVFSPHTGNSVLDWYSEISATAKSALMMTFAFGIDDRFKDVYRRDDDVLRYALLDEVGTGSRKHVEEEAKAVQEIRNRPNVVVAIGNRIETNSFDRWLEEIDSIIPSPKVPWIHTKFMLVDPLGKEPVTITGSANWSEASTSSNTENMVVIRGDERVADIYLGEFMRLHAHYAFREAVGWARKSKEKWEPQNLAPDDSWQSDYFDPSNERYRKRLYFAG